MKIVLIASVLTIATSLPQGTPRPLHQTGSIELPHVEGRIDHLAADVAGGRLFVAALGNNTLEVVDVQSGRVTKSVPGFDEPQGIRYLPEARRVVVANGGNGAVMYLDGSTLSVVHTVKLSGDADNVRYDARTRRVYVGYGNGALSILDDAGKTIGDVRLSAHPESFQLETNGARIFVNVPSARQIAVVDRDKQALITTWPVTQAGANYPMALDEANHRLFIGCRSPARFLVYDTASGRLVTSADIVGDTDDLFYDAANRRIYVMGGGGSITILEQQDADHYRTVQTLTTAAGARTGLFVPEMATLFLAVPHRAAQRSELRVISAGN